MTMAKVPQTKKMLEDTLVHSWESLQEFCRKFDAGEKGYARNMSGTLRMLLKDKGDNFKSLLGQMGLKDTLFIDSAAKMPSGGFGKFSGLFCAPVGGKNPTFIPYLDEPIPGSLRKIAFDEWWNQVVLIDDSTRAFTRQELVGFMADNVGGIHVDPEIDEAYSRISGDNPLNMHSGDSENLMSPITEAATAAMRQITHEVLRTFIPDYPTQKMVMQEGVGAVVGAFHISRGVPDSISTIPKAGVNEPCPCGALREDGKFKKYKKCHGSPVINKSPNPPDVTT